MSSELQHKLINYEVTPPAGAWEKIAAALDEPERGYQFPAKLYGLEIDPPFTAWENIKAYLPAAQPAIPGRKTLAPVFRYAAAAVFIGLIAWGGFKLFSKKSGNDKIVQQELVQPEQVSGDTLLKQDKTVPGDNQLADLDEARNDSALEASKKTYAKLDIAARNKIKKVTDDYFTIVEPVSEMEPETYNELHYAGAIGSALSHHYGLNANSITDRYITLMTPDGNIIRMSKKLSDLVCCVSGEEQDEDCKDQLKTWRKKIACSSITSSSDNFIDILTLASSLQENH